MSNPARDLHTLLTAWKASIPTQGGRLLHAFDPRQQAGSEELARFYSLVTQIDELLSGYESRGLSVNLYRRQLVNWRRAPIGISGQWGGTSPSENILPQEWLDQVEAFALYLDGKVFDFSRDHAAALTEIVDSALDLLSEDSLPPEMARYVHDLLMSIKAALNYERIGLTFDFANAVRALYIAFAAAESKSPEKAGFWAELGRKIVFDGTSHLVNTTLTAAATIAITAG